MIIRYYTGKMEYRLRFNRKTNMDFTTWFFVLSTPIRVNGLVNLVVGEWVMEMGSHMKTGSMYGTLW